MTNGIYQPLDNVTVEGDQCDLKPCGTRVITGLVPCFPLSVSHSYPTVPWWVVMISFKHSAQESFQVSIQQFRKERVSANLRLSENEGVCAVWAQKHINTAMGACNTFSSCLFAVSFTHVNTCPLTGRKRGERRWKPEDDVLMCALHQRHGVSSFATAAPLPPLRSWCHADVSEVELGRYFVVR